MSQRSLVASLAGALAAFGLSAVLAAPAAADTLTATSTRIGAFTYHSLSNGVTGTSQRIGATTWSRFSTGLQATTIELGNTRYTTFTTPYAAPRLGAPPALRLGGVAPAYGIPGATPQPVAPLGGALLLDLE